VSLATGGALVGWWQSAEKPSEDLTARLGISVSETAPVGFRSGNGNTLRKVPAVGGPAVEMARSPREVRGATWTEDGRVTFGTQGGGLFVVSDAGGDEPEPLTALQAEGDDHAWPSLIPERDAVVFTISGRDPITDGRLAVLDLASSEVTMLGLPGLSPHYVTSGHLVYAAADGVIGAVGFDREAVQILGSPVPVVEGVAIKDSGAADYSVSNNGTLV